MNIGDVVVLRADKIYASYGKPVPYYLVMSSHNNNLVVIHDYVNNATVAAFRDDLIVISKCNDEKNF